MVRELECLNREMKRRKERGASSGGREVDSLERTQPMNTRRRDGYNPSVLQKRVDHDTSVKERAVNSKASYDMFMNVFNSLRGHLDQGK